MIAAAQLRGNKTYVVPVIALVALGACAPLAEVREINPLELGGQPGTMPQLRRAEQAIADAQKLKRTDPNRAVGFYLCGLEAATKELRKNPGIGWLCVITTSPYPACFR